jgi:hypothetical protein
MKKITILFAILCFTFSNQTQAQFASYSFDTNTNDAVNDYHATTYGDVSYLIDGSSYVIELEGDEFLSLPTVLSSNIDSEDSFMYSIRFKIVDNYMTTPYNDETANEGTRMLVSNKIEGRGGLGFELYYGEWYNEHYLFATYGDDMKEGHLDNVGKIETGVWYDLAVKMNFDTPTPYVQYVLNEDIIEVYFSTEHVDVEIFKTSLDNQQVFIGADANNQMADEYVPYAKVNIDKLAFNSPVPQGDATVINTVMTAFVNDMNGTVPLSSSEKEDLYNDFVIHWDDDSYAPNKAIISSYLTACDSKYGVIFSDSVRIKMQEMSLPHRMQFRIQKWMFDHLYSTDNIPEMEGVSFLDHIVFPGAVSSTAPRVSNVSFSIDGTYKTDPGFYLNNQDRVIRPIGYYAPPGELVSLTVPASLINQGAEVRVGSHTSTNVHEVNRFPYVSKTFDISNTSITVANPLGGAIYIILPDGSDYGKVTCQISGAVKAPYYCNKPGFERSLADYKTDLTNNYVQWVDWESSKFMTTFPAPSAALVNNPEDVITLWDQTFDMFNVIAGRPLERFRAEYILVDKMNPASGTAASASNPMPIVVNNIFIADPAMTPIDIVNGDSFITGIGRGTNGVTNNVILHEMGHLHNMPTLWHEQESNVNVPAIAVYNNVFGKSMDDALKYSLNQRLNFDESALDWILTPLFRNGERMGIDTYNYNEYWDGIQLRYQHRSFAKYGDIAQLFSWEKLGDIHEYFYQEGLITPFFSNWPEDDTYISAASNQLNTNMAPLFEFWGILPSDNLVETLKNTPVDDKIKDRLLHYRSIVPADSTAYKVIYDSMTEKLEDHHDVRYDNMLSTYNELVADSIVARIDVILCKYYNANCIAANSDGTPTVTFALSAESVDENSATDVTLTATLDVLSSEAVTIDFSLSGKAVEATDYTVSSHSIAIGAGAQLGSISISTNGLDDSTIEVLQTIVLTPTLTNATTTTETVTLNLLSDDNPTVTAITTSETSIAENGGVSVITATIDTPASKPTHIALDITGTASYEVDYMAAYSSKGEFTITTVAGGNGVGTANNQFNLASGLYVDTAGNIYVADLLNHRIQKCAPDATECTTVAGGNGAGAAANQLNNPHGVFVDTSGNIYIADSENHRVQKWMPGATEGTTVAGGNGKGIATQYAKVRNQLHTPMGVFVTTNGDVYVADTGNHRIQKWVVGATTGLTVAEGTVVNGEYLSQPQGVFVTANGDVYVADTGTSRVTKWIPGSPDSINITSYTNGSADANQLNGTSAVYINAFGDAYIADYGNNRIQKWLKGATEGITVAGGNGSGNAANQLNGPKAVFVDVLGDFYVADIKNHRIQKYQYGPRITIPAGETTGTLTITAIDEDLDDDEETIVITPISVSNAVTTPTGSHMITILDDDDQPVVNFTLGSENIDENAATAVTLTATLSAVSNNEVAIDFTLSGTATQTTEYTLSSANITIPAGTSSGSIAISTKGLDDATIEVIETIVLTPRISNAASVTNAAAVTLNLLSDDNPTVTAITASATSIEENVGSSVIIATIDVAASKPTTIAFDITGTAIRIEDYSTAFSSKGKVVTVAGGNGEGAAANQFREPAGIFVDASDNVYAVDVYNHRIQKWTPGASQGITVAGVENGVGSGHNLHNLYTPRGVYVTTDGSVYIADTGNHRIQKWGLGESLGTSVAGGHDQGSAANQLNTPIDVYVDTSGNVYIADTENHRIQKWVPGAASGTTVAGGNGQGTAANQLNRPHGVYVDASANVYISDTENHRIQKWAPGAAEGTTVAGGNGAGAAANQLNNPKDVYVDTSQNIYIADTYNWRIQKWEVGATEGIEIRDDSNPLGQTQSIYVGTKDNVYATDKNNNRIQKYQYFPEITIAAGATSGTLTLTALEDSLDEDSETIILTPTIATNAKLSATTTITVTIFNGSSLHDVDFVMNDVGTVLVYPNPITNSKQFTIAGLSLDKKIGITIYDVLGKELFKQSNKVSNGIVEVSVKTLSSGFYFVKITTKKGTVIKKIIIKE